MYRAAIILVVTLLTSPALAAAGPWQDIAPNVRARLISAGPAENGRLLAGLEIEMPQSTNTYWRIPGETGIPTQLDFSASPGVTGTRIHWPFPLIEDIGGYRDFVYRGPTVIPFELTLDAPTGEVQASAMLGICDDVCVPVMTSLTLPLDAAPDPAQSLRIRQAMALAPIDWNEEANAVGAVTISATGDGIDLHDVASGVDPARLIVDTGDPSVLFDVPQKRPEAAIWTLPLLGGAGAEKLVGQTILLTFETADGPYTAGARVGPAIN